MIVTFDIETYKREGEYLVPTLNSQEFTLGVILKDTGKLEFFYNAKDMQEYILEIIKSEKKRNRRTFFYGHNTSYDFYGIFKDLISKDLFLNFEDDKQIKIIVPRKPFMAMYGSQPKDNWKFTDEAYFLDTMGYYNMSLAEVGKIVNLPKMEAPVKIKNPDELKEYLERDVRITMTAIRTLKETLNELGYNPKRLLSMGNTAITCFFTHCKKNKLAYIYSYAGRTYQSKYTKYTRQALRGARTECFKIGKTDNVMKLDCNAMYPYMMINMDFPLLNKEEYIEGDECSKKLDKIGTVKVDIEAPDESKIKFAYLGIRYNKYLVFPFNRELRGVWTTLEIKRAIELGYKVKKWHWGVFYETSPINPFKNYLTELWNLRRNSEGGKKVVIKLLMNSLFGKWSQYRSQENLVCINRGQTEEYEKLGFEFVRTSGSKYIMGRKSEPKLPRYANPMISAWITALGRDYLYNNMCRVPTENLLYVCTDGLIIKAKDLNSMSTCGIHMGQEMGEFKLEEEGVCEIMGENKYHIANKPHISGIPKRDIDMNLLRGNKKLIVNKQISIAEARINPELKDKVGTFRQEEHKLEYSQKNNLLLPLIIEEFPVSIGGWSI